MHKEPRLFRRAPRNESRTSRPSVSSTTSKIAAGVVSLFGISGVLYGAGFLVLRSHYTFLGMWGGVPWTSEQVAEEGGRFFYSLLYAPVSLYSNLDFVLLLFILLAISWDVRRWAQRMLPERVLKKIGTRAPLSLGKFRSLFPTLTLSLILVGTVVMFNTIWVVVGIQDVLHSPEKLVGTQFETAQGRAALYSNILWRVAIGVLVGWYLYRSFWPGTIVIQRLFVLAQWLIVLAALFTLPVAYGKLLMPTSYRLFTNGSSQLGGACLVLVGQTSDSWVVWDVNRKQTVILSRSDKEPVVISSYLDLLK